MKQRLDKELVNRGFVASRSQAESYIRLGLVLVNGKPVIKAGYFVDGRDRLELKAGEQYVSRAGLKLASVAEYFGLDFKDKVVLDVGSSTGGFTDFALKNDAKKVIAVDVGTDQLHPSLRNNQKVELHEQTDIRGYDRGPSSTIDIVVVDVSFVSLRDILPSIKRHITKNTKLIAMVKPQFEAQSSRSKHKGVVKNESVRREILKDFEAWCRDYFFIENKKDSEVRGEKGNTERFYVLRILS